MTETASGAKADRVKSQRIPEGRGAMKTEAAVLFIVHPSFRASWGAPGADRLEAAYTESGERGSVVGTGLQAHDLLDDGERDVRDGPVAVAVGQDLLCERDEDGA